MIILNTKRATELATDILGEHCQVILELDPGILGRAWMTDSGDKLISVSPFQTPASAIHTYFHELFHHAAGHVKAPRRRTAPVAEVVGRKSPEVAEALKSSHDQGERACDAFADSIIAKLDASAWQDLLVDTED